MDDQPEPTPEAKEQVPERQEGHVALRGAGHEHPPELPHEEIHDA